MNSPRTFNLALPPREVPLLVQIRVIFGGSLSQFGWGFLGFGLIFVQFLAPYIDLTSRWHFRGQLETTSGVVTFCEKTNMSEGGGKGRQGTPIYRIGYQFTLDGVTREGVSYSKGRTFEQGASVVVEHPQGDPDISRIKGLRRAPFDIWLAFVFLFPLGGLGIVIGAVRQGLKANHLLKFGYATVGVLKSKEPTNTRVNKQPVYKLIFEFTGHDGQPYQAEVKTHASATIEDDPHEPLVYAPINPSGAVLVDALPGAPRIDDRGLIQTKSIAASVLSLFLPTIVVVGNITLFFVRPDFMK